MTKTGEPQQPITFSKQFTQEIEKYIQTTPKPTVKGFANSIGVDQYTVWAWARKKRKDEQGNITEQLSRPNFHAFLTKLESLEKAEQEDKLNPKQELFSQLYATDREFFGNGVQTYIEVYEPNKSKPNWYKLACTAASEILSNPKVCNRINELLEDGGLNDQNVDKQLMFLITQFEDKNAKIAAIREYNKLKKRITEKMDLTSKGEKINQVVGFNYLPPAKPDEPINTND